MIFGYLIEKMMIVRFSPATVAMTVVLYVFSIAWGDFADENQATKSTPGSDVLVTLSPATCDRLKSAEENAQAARDEVEMRLKVRIKEINEVCELTPAQAQKLDLAGRWEIKRLFKRIEAAQRTFESVRDNLGDVTKVYEEVYSLRLSFTSQAFHEGTSFHKVALSCLTQEQIPRYQQQLEDRFLLRRMALQKSFIATVNMRNSLEKEQVASLEALLNELPVNPGPYEGRVLWYLASQVPEERYREILNDDQWRKLQANFALRRDLGQLLKQAGVLVEENSN